MKKTAGIGELRKYNGKNIVITGSSGLIGSELAITLMQTDCNLLLVDMAECDFPVKDARARVRQMKGNITENRVWNKILPGADIVFHLAALEYNRRSFDTARDLEINSLSVARMLETCVNLKLEPKIVFSSSANLFRSKTGKVNENSPSEPVSLWSAHKRLAEDYLKIYSLKYGLKGVILRLANIYGPTTCEKSMLNVVINKAANSALEKGKLALYANRNCLRDYLYIDDAVDAFLKAGLTKHVLPNEGFYVVGSGEGKTMKQAWEILATEIKRQTGKIIKIKADRSIVLEQFDFRDFKADHSLFTSLTGWRPRTNLQEGLAKTVKRLNSGGRVNGTK